MRGVVYIGMTGKDNTLRKRFAQLACAWRTPPQKGKPSHGSRGHYNKDPKAKKLFKVKDVRIQFMPLPSDARSEAAELEAFAKKTTISATDFRSIMALELTGDKRVADMEAIKMQCYKRLVGYIPMLNRDEEGKGDKPPTDKELKKLLDRT